MKLLGISVVYTTKLAEENHEDSYGRKGLGETPQRSEEAHQPP
jgi:hypothetical protein